MELRKSLEALTAEYDKAMASGDAEAAAAFFTEDAIFLTQGHPVVRGKAAIRSMLQEWIDVKLSGTHEILTCEEEGNLAFLTGTFSVQYENQQGETEKLPGKYMEIFRRQPGESWKVHASCAFTD